MPTRQPPAKDRDLTVTIRVDQSPKQVYDAINDVRGWWTGDITGRTDRKGSTWTYRFQDLHRSTQRITELVPGRKVVWHVVDSYLSFVKDHTEWNGTDIVFDIARRGSKTELRFTHVGLAPVAQCFGDCSSAWRYYVRGGLRQRITTGRPVPTSPT